MFLLLNQWWNKVVCVWSCVCFRHGRGLGSSTGWVGLGWVRQWVCL